MLIEVAETLFPHVYLMFFLPDIIHLTLFGNMYRSTPCFEPYSTHCPSLDKPSSCPECIVMRLGSLKNPVRNKLRHVLPFLLLIFSYQFITKLNLQKFDVIYPILSCELFIQLYRVIISILSFTAYALLDFDDRDIKHIR